MELSLIKLWHATGKCRCLNLATYFGDNRGPHSHHFDQERDALKSAGKCGQCARETSQSHLPVRHWAKVVGHAVRAKYLSIAMTDLAGENGCSKTKGS